MKKKASTISGILYLICSIVALLLGLFSNIDYCTLLEVPILFINILLFGLTYLLNSDDKLRLNLFSIETIIGYIGIMFLFLIEQTYYNITEDGVVYNYYSAVGNIEEWLCVTTIVTVVINILSLFDKKEKLKKIFNYYYITVFLMSVIMLIYLLINLF